MRAVSALGMAVMLLVVVVLGSTGAATALGTPGTAEPEIRLVELEPWVTAKDLVRATVRIEGASRGATLTPTLHSAVTTRSSFALTMGGNDLGATTATLSGHELSSASATVAVGFAVDDGTAGADGTPPPRGDSVSLTRPGVYPLVFTLTDPDGTEIASMVTYLVRLPTTPTGGDDGRRPLRVASEFRLQPRPTMTASGRLVVSAAERRSTKELLDGVGDTTAAVRQSFGYTISPSFVDSLVETRATDDVADLAALVDGLPLQSQPWAPVDPAGWSATPSLAPALDRATSSGDQTLGDHLHRPVEATADLAAWGGRISEPSLRWFAKRRATTVLVPDRTLSALDTSTFPRSLAAPFRLDIGESRTIRAMQLDSAIADHFTAADPVLGANQLIADLSIIAGDLPAISRAMVVAPPAGWAPSAAFLAAYVRALETAHPSGSDPLLAPTALADIVESTPLVRAAGDTATEGPTLVRTLKNPAAPAPMSDLGTHVADADTLVDSFATTLPGGRSRAVTTILRLRRQISVAAVPGTAPAERDRRFAAVRAEVTTTMADVRLPPRQTITLTSNTASIPVTIRRGENGPTEVVVHVDAPDRLELPDGPAQPVHLDATTNRFAIRVHSDSPGDTIVRLTVSSPDGKLVGGTTELVVRSTSASGVGFVISFGSLAFLILWWGRDIIRTRRRRRARHIPPAELIDID